MYARSFLWSIRDIQTCLDNLHSKPSLVGNAGVVSQINDTRRSVGEIVELLRGGRIYRPSVQTHREDALLYRLLQAMYDCKTGSIEAITTRVEGGQKTINALQSTGQIEQKQREFFVPLIGNNTAKNWPPVLELIVERIGYQAQECKNLIQKVRADGVSSGMIEYTTLQSLVKRLDSLYQVLRSHLGQLQVINYTLTVDRTIERFLSDTIPKAFGLQT